MLRTQGFHLLERLRYMNVIFSITESAVAIDIPGFHRVFARGTGVEQFCDLLAAPRPEAHGVDLIWYGKIDAYHRIAVCHGDRSAVFPGLRIVADGVIESVLHPFRFIEVSDEQILFATGSKVPCLRLGQRRLIQQAPIAGWGGECIRFLCGKHTVVVLAHGLDFVSVPIGTEDDITFLGSRLRFALFIACQWGNLHIVGCRSNAGIRRIALDLNTVLLCIPINVEPYGLANVAEPQIVASVNGISIL